MYASDGSGSNRQIVGAIGYRRSIMTDSRKEKRKRRRKANKETRERAFRQGKSRRLLIWYAWRSFEVLVIIAAAYAYFFQLPATFSPSLQTVLNLSDPFSTQFTFVNDGYFAAREVQPQCILNFVTFPRNMKVRNGMAWDKNNLIPLVRAKDRLTFPCIFPFVGSGFAKIESADITLTVSYRSSLIPWHSNQGFRFILKVSTNGVPNWLQQPVN
jgi:hypothetical protein